MDQSAAEHLTQPSSQLLTSQLKQTRPWKSAAGAYLPPVLARASLLGGQRSPGPLGKGGTKNNAGDAHMSPPGRPCYPDKQVQVRKSFLAHNICSSPVRSQSPQEAASTTGLCACSPPGMCSLCRHSASPSAILVFAPFAGAVCRR